MKKVIFTFLVLFAAFQVNAQVEEEVIEIEVEEVIEAEPAEPQDEPVFQVVEEMPKFPGGEEARKKFVAKNVKYPKAAIADTIQGTVYVQFVVEKDGSLSDIKVIRGIGGGCDEEVIRIVKLMPKWTPGKQRGKAVRVKFIMPVRFALN